MATRLPVVDHRVWRRRELNGKIFSWFFLLTSCDHPIKKGKRMIFFYDDDDDGDRCRCPFPFVVLVEWGTVGAPLSASGWDSTWARGCVRSFLISQYISLGSYPISNGFDSVASRVISNSLATYFISRHPDELVISRLFSPASAYSDFSTLFPLIYLVYIE